MPDTVPAHLLARLDEEPGEHPGRQSYGFVAACVDAGLPDSAVLALGLEHRPTKDKWAGYDKRLQEVNRSLGKLRQELPDASASQVRPSGDAVGTHPGNLRGG